MVLLPPPVTPAVPPALVMVPPERVHRYVMPACATTDAVLPVAPVVTAAGAVMVGVDLGAAERERPGRAGRVRDGVRTAAAGDGAAGDGPRIRHARVRHDRSGAAGGACRHRAGSGERWHRGCGDHGHALRRLRAV